MPMMSTDAGPILDQPSLTVRDESGADPGQKVSLNVWPGFVRHVGNWVDLPTIDTGCLVGSYQNSWGEDNTGRSAESSEVNSDEEQV